MTELAIEDRMTALEKRSDACEKRTQEMLNRILFQQERFDQVLNVHSNMIESNNTIVEAFITKEIPLREWFMKQADENRKFSSGIILKFVGVFVLMVFGVLGLENLLGGL